MIEHVDDGYLDYCPTCGKFLKHGEYIHPETWFCKRCDKLIATDETTEDDQKHVDEIYNRLVRKFFVLIRKELRTVGAFDRSVITMFFIKGNRKKAIQKFIDVNCLGINVVPNGYTFKMLIKNGDIDVDPYGRAVVT